MAPSGSIWHKESLKLKEIFGTREAFEICPNNFSPRPNFAPPGICRGKLSVKSVSCGDRGTKAVPVPHRPCHDLRGFQRPPKPHGATLPSPSPGARGQRDGGVRRPRSPLPRRWRPPAAHVACPKPRGEPSSWHVRAGQSSPLGTHVADDLGRSAHTRSTASARGTPMTGGEWTHEMSPGMAWGRAPEIRGRPLGGPLPPTQVKGPLEGHTGAPTITHDTPLDHIRSRRGTHAAAPGLMKTGPDHPPHHDPLFGGEAASFG